MNKKRSFPYSTVTFNFWGFISIISIALKSITVFCGTLLADQIILLVISSYFCSSCNNHLDCFMQSKNRTIIYIVTWEKVSTCHQLVQGNYAQKISHTCVIHLHVCKPSQQPLVIKLKQSGISRIDIVTFMCKTLKLFHTVLPYNSQKKSPMILGQSSVGWWHS